eukprot:TRINITY_DN7824_c0_g1_i1.p1 TRINITY_DN7824_c0_g1~~TRINITY_DN7824_c0_g1_i1.p1  ORF type:complete len:353 (-),score=30.90 TRINITY_DN7824_c0_g1_i1:867-1925(-)
MRVPVSDMATLPFAIEHQHLAVALLEVTTPLVVYLHYRPTRNPLIKKAVMHLYYFFQACSVLSLLYWWAGCPVSPARFSETAEIFAQNLGFVEQSQWAATAWAAEGTMLAIIRGGATLNRWDQDSDMWLAVDGTDGDAALSTLKELEAQVVKYQQERGSKYNVRSVPERWLIQVYGPNGGHGDLWLWQRHVHNGHKVLYNPDFTYAGLRFPDGPPGGQRYPEEWILPTSKIDWNGLSVPVAHNPPAMLASQYGPSFMTPYLNQLQCQENFATKVHPSPWFFISTGAVVAYTIWGGIVAGAILVRAYTHAVDLWAHGESGWEWLLDAVLFQIRVRRKLSACLSTTPSVSTTLV